MASIKGLSARSPYEQKFKTRYRGSGRPKVAQDEEPMFPSEGLDRLIVRTAARRAFAVVHDEQKDRLRALYRQELAVLKRRGVEQVRLDLGMELSTDDAPEPDDEA